MAGFRALILDVDGTMMDTERAMIDLWEQIGREMGYDFDRAVLISTVGTTYEETGRIVRAAFPDAPNDAILGEVSRRFHAMRDRGEVPVKPGARALLAAARERGLPVGVCTSTPRESIERTLEAAGLLALVDASVCAGEAGRGKPDPAPYLLAAHRLGVPPGECLAVEDSPHGARSALGAGMAVAVVPDLVEPPGDVRRRAMILSSLRDVIALIGEKEK